MCDDIAEVRRCRKSITKPSDLTPQILHGLSDLSIWILYLVCLIYNHSRPVNAVKEQMQNTGN